jgi:hypothetical protein
MPLLNQYDENIKPHDHNSEYNILRTVAACLHTEPWSEPILALKVLDGPYRGVKFSYRSFRIMKEPEGFQQEVGQMVPVKFETIVHEAPKGFVADEAFDNYCSDLLVTWLSFVHKRSAEQFIEHV